MISFNKVAIKIVHSAASTAARHSAPIVLFTTRRILRLCHVTGLYNPLLSIRKDINPPWEPALGRFAKLASQKETTLTE